MSAANGSYVKVPDGLHWGYKLVGVDLTTDDHNGGRFRYRPGEWVESTKPKGKRYSGPTQDCPTFPGDGVCVARTLSGAQSGGARLGASTMLLVGYLPDDVLSDFPDKLRVKRLWVYPEPLDPVRLIVDARANLAGANLVGANLARANLAGANLAGADLAGANLAGANLGSAVRPSWLSSRWAVTGDGYVTVSPSPAGS